MLHSFHVTLCPRCTLFMFCYFRVALFSCCILFVLHYFHGALFWYCAIVMLLFSCCILFILYLPRALSKVIFFRADFLQKTSEKLPLFQAQCKSSNLKILLNHYWQIVPFVINVFSNTQMECFCFVNLLW